MTVKNVQGRELNLMVKILAFDVGVPGFSFLCSGFKLLVSAGLVCQW